MPKKYSRSFKRVKKAGKAAGFLYTTWEGDYSLQQDHRKVLLGKE